MNDQDRLGPPPVEPLSDLSWARVERGLWTRMDSDPTRVVSVARSRPWLWAAVPALAFAALALVLFGRGSESPDAGSTGQADGQPMRVVSGAASSAVMFGDAHVTLDADSAVVMSRDLEKQSALLEHGAAWFSIAPRGSRPPFVVVAGDTVVRVIGTRFRVARSDERATVEVDHGIVEVQYRGGTVQLRAGQRWTSQQPSQVVAAEPAVVETATVDEPVVDSKPATRRSDTRRGDTRRTEPSDVKAKSTDAHLLDSEQPEIARTQYERMQALEVRDPAAALAGYLALSRGTTRWAEVALFAASRLAADRHDTRAEGLLKNYLQRFPAGANVDDARELLAHLKGDH
ncbi:MAG: anti-FecI sigma factor, FecR [Deltaproteobacteria bacterium]|nr:anti-FecI sigma factor, FecR [Deltaproteobacteria bacterium]